MAAATTKKNTARKTGTKANGDTPRGWISPAERDQIIVKMTKHLSLREVGEIMDLSPQRVGQIARRAKTKTKR